MNMWLINSTAGAHTAHDTDLSLKGRWSTARWYFFQEKGRIHQKSFSFAAQILSPQLSKLVFTNVQSSHLSLRVPLFLLTANWVWLSGPFSKMFQPVSVAKNATFPFTFSSLDFRDISPRIWAQCPFSTDYVRNMSGTAKIMKTNYVIL